MTRIYLSGRLYDWFIEPLVGNIRQYVGRLVSEYELSPILDICCGTATQTHILNSKGYRAFGLDLSLQAVKYAVWKNPQVPVICADATQSPFKKASFKGIVLSFSLHDKSPAERNVIMVEAKRLLDPGGKMIFVDYECPWSRRSRLGAFPLYLIELTAGGAHFRNYRQFLKQGGLRSFIRMHDLIEVSRQDMAWRTVAVAVARLP
ncbi:MAG: class I SAM-dependent methyltransferase [Candidatus Aminicenantes bacterium]|nr:class I SAM-dependent methyltransferase [Candidatus Aminicenantes bacterium]